MSILLLTVQRDLLLYVRKPGDIFNPLAFSLLVISLFPLGLGPSSDTLNEISAGIIWVAALLTTLFSIDLMFKEDYEDGTLEQMILGKESLLLVVYGKIIAQWLVGGLVITLVSPLFGLMFYVNTDGIVATVLALMLATPTMTLIGSIGAALTLGVNKGGVLITILILPLYLPLLILGVAMIDTASAGDNYTGHALWLAAILAISIGFAPLATEQGIRISLSE